MESVRAFFRVFFGTEDGGEMKRKGLFLAVLFPSYYWISYLLVGLTGTFVGFLKYYEFADLTIFFILWIANMIYSGSVVFASDKSGLDFTLMEALRRFVDKGIERSKFMGYLAEIGILVYLLVWEGPDQFILFFRSRLSSMTAKVWVFVFASGFQMAVWTIVFVIGYEYFVSMFF